MRILIAECEVELQNLMSEIFRGKGFEVLIAQDGQEALDLYNNYFPQVILSEYFMPKLNGLDILKSVKSRKVQPLFILMSSMPASARKGFRDPLIDLYLEKPFNTSSLIEFIETSLRRKAS